MLHLLLLLLSATAAPAATSPELTAAQQADWQQVAGDWQFGDGVLEQTVPDRMSKIVLAGPAWGDFKLTVEVNIRAEGAGVRAAAVLFRATGTMTHYWLHLDSKNGNAILVRTTPTNNWIELGRRPCKLTTDAWHSVEVSCHGRHLAVAIDGAPVLAFDDEQLAAGRLGLGTSQGRVAFRNLRIEGAPVDHPAPLNQETPPYRVISRGGAAGPYQAFPDICRLQNGDLLAVFYDGYGHVSVPNEQWPKGGRVGMVRSSDEGRTWTSPEILFDDERDNRDPHIAQLADGTVICSFFSRLKEPPSMADLAVQVARSNDQGHTWETTAQTLVTGWACSAPVRQMPDGTCLLGIYTADGKASWGGVIRSTDGGKTWDQPIPIGQEAGLPLDAETDVILLRDGTLYAALRSSSIDMYYATSPDLGLTWSEVKDIGFKGHCPHLNRLSTGVILLCHRVPSTSLHLSRDDTQTWQGPFVIDSVGGAYPATVELKDGSVLVIYYEEGTGSAIRVQRLKVTGEGIEPLDWN